ncbi:UDP-N-acetylmuramoyl-L-alanyl-D-glutamate--2,6-diaminopimelate ligase [Intrasporangium oryzae]|uniref:UDP-N-acetylmuramoyl-L-alanyl-D-glutamate--2, 6-diaminopimelate ligase n=1 Tax=Intrasporangium oryzae TaxID=412687 RepID=UPI0004B9B8ED|nr:UDP-N-acetylmuramoyl-L-alanyl-D-glutamate--2,6-diaminopimelate ligase [Intrasporangium oryzae]
MLLNDLTARLGAEVSSPEAASGVRVAGVSLDSRAVLEGDLYAALPGFNTHGAAFAGDAIRLGAVAVLTDPAGAARLSGVEVPVVVVAQPREVLGAVAAQVYGDPSARLTMVGVTGTNGKTTTAYLVESALRAHGRRTGLIGTVETRIGDERVESVRTTPEATDLHAILGVMVERGVDACVMEVSSHALSLHRVDGVVYDVALFTNLSQDHLDFHDSMDDYYRAKATLFTRARARAGVVCIDDAWGLRLASESEIPVTTLGTVGQRADWTVEAGDGGRFALRDAAGMRELGLVSHLPGTFNIANTALAALALLSLGLDETEVEAAMAVPPDVPGRMEVVAAGGAGGPRCIVDFAHTPDAVDAALAALRPSTTGRLIAVIGAGGDRDRGKRPGMGAAAARHADVVVVTDDNPRSEDAAEIRAAVMAGARQAVESGNATAQVVDGGPRSGAIAEAVAMAVVDASDGAVDTVVVLGKGHEKGQEIHGVKHPFDDRDALRAALSAATTTEDRR